MKLDKSCGNCRFSQQWGAALRCRRNPPSERGTWPPVDFQNVCGEFRSAAPHGYEFNEYDFNTHDPEI